MFKIPNKSLINFEKKKVKVKAFIRKGKLVKSYSRDHDFRDKMIAAVTGGGLVAGGFLLGKKGGNTKKIISRVINNTKNIDKDEIVEAVVNKLNKEKIAVNNTVKDVIQKGTNEVNDIPNITNLNSIELVIPKVKLPKNIFNVSQKSLGRIEKEVVSLTDDQLNSKIEQLSKRVAPAIDSADNLSKAESFNLYLSKLKDPKLNDEPLKKTYRQSIEELRSYFKISKDIKNEDLTIVPTVDEAYKKQLLKYIKREKEIRDIYIKEESRRSKSILSTGTPTYEDTLRMRDIMDDFSSYNKNIMIFLSDINTNFARKLGSKDKRKRNMRNALIGLGVAGAGIGGALLLRRNVSKDAQKVQKIINSSNNTSQKLKNDFDEINNNIRNYNSTANKTKPTSTTITTTSDLDSLMTGKPTKKRFTTSTGYVSKNLNRKQIIGVKKAKRSTGSSFENINIVKRKLNNPNSTWEL